MRREFGGRELSPSYGTTGTGRWERKDSRDREYSSTRAQHEHRRSERFSPPRQLLQRSSYGGECGRSDFDQSRRSQSGHRPPGRDQSCPHKLAAGPPPGDPAASFNDFSMELTKETDGGEDPLCRTRAPRYEPGRPYTDTRSRSRSSATRAVADNHPNEPAAGASASAASIKTQTNHTPAKKEPDPGQQELTSEKTGEGRIGFGYSRTQPRQSPPHQPGTSPKQQNVSRSYGGGRGTSDYAPSLLPPDKWGQRSPWPPTYVPPEFPFAPMMVSHHSSRIGQHQPPFTSHRPCADSKTPGRCPSLAPSSWPATQAQDEPAAEAPIGGTAGSKNLLSQKSLALAKTAPGQQTPANVDERHFGSAHQKPMTRNSHPDGQPQRIPQSGPDSIPKMYEKRPGSTTRPAVDSVPDHKPRQPIPDLARLEVPREISGVGSRQACNNLIFTADDAVRAVMVKLRGRYIRAVIDTGSAVSLVSGQLLHLYEELAVDDTIFQRQRADMMIHTVVGSVTVRSQLRERLLFGTARSYIEATVRLYEIPEEYCQFDILLGLEWWSQMGNPTLDLQRETLTLPGWPDLPLRLTPFQPALYNPGAAEFDLPDRGDRAVRFWQRLRVDPGPPEEPGRGRDHSQLLPSTASGAYGNGTGTSGNGRDSGGQARDSYGGDRGGRGRCGRRPNNAGH